MPAESSELMDAILKAIDHLQAAIGALEKRVAQVQQLLEEEGESPLDRELASIHRLEVGIVSDGVLKGSLEWVSGEALGIRTESEAPKDVIVFKHAITYIRKLDGEDKERAGMYV